MSNKRNLEAMPIRQAKILLNIEGVTGLDMFFWSRSSMQRFQEASCRKALLREILRGKHLKHNKRRLQSSS
jgi:hypothetical protein